MNLAKIESGQNVYVCIVYAKGFVIDLTKWVPGFGDISKIRKCIKLNTLAQLLHVIEETPSQHVSKKGGKEKRKKLLNF